MTHYLVQQGIFVNAPFMLIDVGCSGGIDPIWRIFGESLSAVGFDPMIEECERLLKKEKNPNVKYVNAFIGLDSSPSLNLKTTADALPSFNRHTSGSACLILKGKLSKQDKINLLNDWENQNLTSDSPISIDRYVSDNNIDNVDFIKIDVGGRDIDVLRSCETTINSKSILGIQIKTSFEGGEEKEANTFLNVDRFMRSCGYALYELATCKQSKTALPLPFSHETPSQTVGGKVTYGNAIYFKDLCDSGQIDHKTEQLSWEKILKLACCYEIFGQYDSAAELLLHHSDKFANFLSLDTLLDLLTISTGFYGGLKYKDVINNFNKDPELFYQYNYLLQEHHQTLLSKIERWSKQNHANKRLIVFGANKSGAFIAEEAKKHGIEFVGYADNHIKTFQGHSIIGATEIADMNPGVVVIVSKAHSDTIKQQLLSMYSFDKFEIISNAKEYVLVHQMGKVGSSTINETLGSSCPNKQVIQRHWVNINNIDEFIRCMGISDLNNSEVGLEYKLGFSVSLQEAIKLHNCLQVNECTIVSGIRSPFSYSMSAFFHNTKLLFPEIIDSSLTLGEKIEFIARRINDRFDSFIINDLIPKTYQEEVFKGIFRYYLGWWEEEFQPVYGFDILSLENPDNDYWTFNHGRHRFFIYRYEKINDILPKLVKFVDPDAKFKKINSNITSDKPWGEVYTQFLKVYVPSGSMRKFYRSSPYTKKFYPDLFKEY